jgi:hypothetical protein
MAASRMAFAFGHGGVHPSCPATPAGAGGNISFTIRCPPSCRPAAGWPVRAVQRPMSRVSRVPVPCGPSAFLSRQIPIKTLDGWRSAPASSALTAPFAPNAVSRENRTTRHQGRRWGMRLCSPPHGTEGRPAPGRPCWPAPSEWQTRIGAALAQCPGDRAGGTVTGRNAGAIGLLGPSAAGNVHGRDRRATTGADGSFTMET